MPARTPGLSKRPACPPENSGLPGGREVAAPRSPRTGREDGPGTPLRELGEAGAQPRGHRGRRCGTATPRGARGGRRGFSGSPCPRLRPQVCGDRSRGPGQAHAGGEALPAAQAGLGPPQAAPAWSVLGTWPPAPERLRRRRRSHGDKRAPSAGWGARREPRVGRACTAGASPLRPQGRGQGFPPTGPTPGARGGARAPAPLPGLQAAGRRRGPRTGARGRTAWGSPEGADPGDAPPWPSAPRPMFRSEDTSRPTGTWNTMQQPRARPTGSPGRRGASRSPGGFSLPAGGGGLHCHIRVTRGSHGGHAEGRAVLGVPRRRPRGAPRAAPPGRSPAAATGGHRGSSRRPAGGRRSCGTGAPRAQGPGASIRKARGGDRVLPRARPRGEASELLRRPGPEARAPRGLRRLPCCCPGTGTEQRRPRGNCRRDSLKGKAGLTRPRAAGSAKTSGWAAATLSQ
uniref:translation initiation factor IF-2-like n=1 Tax=Nyctereutes procyonoides TaxID=34880 RepID=UPI002444E85E|nr:translation initiation factor IF-2-like [Nyctereutes procyonoides]